LQEVQQAGKQEVLRLKNDAKQQRQATWRWQKLMGRPLTHTPSRYLANDGSITAVERAAKFWQKQEAEAHKRAQHPAHLAAWLCIHRYEGSWPSTKNRKYHGGLQLDSYFEAAYGSWLVLKYGGHIATDSGGHKYAVGGHAYRWTPLEQMWVAERAFKSRGFWPWPNTARYCGLL
jgi:hypothetical protein